MVEVNPVTGKKYEKGVDYYCVYKVVGRYFYTKESIEHPTDLKWDEFFDAYKYESEAREQVKFLNGVIDASKPICARWKWHTNLRRK